jgi:hypothetical protein
MTTIDLTDLTRGEVTSLIGYTRGENARKHFGLDELDHAAGPIEVRSPANLRTLTPSFVQGFFGDSILTLGEDAFRRHYVFERFSSQALHSVDAGIDRVLMKRSYETTAA